MLLEIEALFEAVKIDPLSIEQIDESDSRTDAVAPPENESALNMSTANAGMSHDRKYAKEQKGVNACANINREKNMIKTCSLMWGIR